MGFTAINAQGLSAPPYFVAFIVCVATTWIADKTQQRGLMIWGLSVVGGVGYILLATCKGVAVRYFSVFLAAAGVFSCIANILPFTLNNQGSDSKRGAGIALLNVVGQTGPLLGTRSKWHSFFSAALSVRSLVVHWKGGALGSRRKLTQT
jgi:hypothetical protein